MTDDRPATDDDGSADRAGPTHRAAGDLPSGDAGIATDRRAALDDRARERRRGAVQLVGSLLVALAIAGGTIAAVTSKLGTTSVSALEAQEDREKRAEDAREDRAKEREDAREDRAKEREEAREGGGGR